MNRKSMTMQANILVDNEILSGKVVRPFIARDQLLGAILSFEGRSETALLHIKQIDSNDPAARLASLSIGEEIRVKISIAMEKGVRKVRASEKELATDQDIVDKLNALPQSHVMIASAVNVASYGVFVTLDDVSDRKGLVHNKNIFGGSNMSLKLFSELVPGKKVHVRMLDVAKLDEAGILRINLAFAPELDAAVAA